MVSTRTQIYLTRDQRRRLDRLSRSRDVALAALIREAVDQYLDRAAPNPAPALDATFGAIPALDAPSRDEWDRG